MCVLIISDCNELPEPARLPKVSAHLRMLIKRARAAHRPVAFMHRKYGLGFDKIGIKIARYEPVFPLDMRETGLPAGLTDFVVGHRTSRLHLAGIASHERFRSLYSMFFRCGIQLEIDDNTRLCLSKERDPTCIAPSGEAQFSEYEAGACSIFDCSASIKNQSTRWPSV